MLHDGVGRHCIGAELVRGPSRLCAEGAGIPGDLIPDGAAHLKQAFWMGDAVLNAGDHVGAEGALAVHAACRSQDGPGLQAVQAGGHRGGTHVYSQPQPLPPGGRVQGKGELAPRRGHHCARVGVLQHRGTVAQHPGAAGQPPCFTGQEKGAATRHFPQVPLPPQGASTARNPARWRAESSVSPTSASAVWRTPR